MSDLHNIIKKALKNNNYYIPSQKSFVKGSCISVKQHNNLLELQTQLKVGFQQFIKYTIATDKILRENLESIDNLTYFDKPFLLIQAKIAQEKKYLDFTLEEYQKAIIEKTINLDLQSFTKVFTYENLEVTLGINKFTDVEKINLDFYNALNNKFEAETDIVTLELLKLVKTIKYHGEDIYNNNVKDVKPLISEFPASLISSFNIILKQIIEELNNINTFNIGEEKYVFNPTLEFMLF